MSKTPALNYREYINEAAILGIVESDPYQVKTKKGADVANFVVLVKDPVQNRTHRHHVSAFGAMHELVMNEIKQGAEVFIKGHMQTYDYEDARGKTMTTTTISIVARGHCKLVILDHGGEGE